MFNPRIKASTLALLTVSAQSLFVRFFLTFSPLVLLFMATFPPLLHLQSRAVRIVRSRATTFDIAKL